MYTIIFLCGLSLTMPRLTHAGNSALVCILLLMVIWIERPAQQAPMDPAIDSGTLHTLCVTMLVSCGAILTHACFRSGVLREWMWWSYV